jgi:Flp pilus assembly protein TadG
MIGPDRGRGAGRGRPRSILCDRRASSGVQFALVLPVFLSMVLGIMDMGRLMWTQNTLAQAAKKSARFAIVHGSTSASPATAADITAAVEQHLAGLSGAPTVNVAWIPDNAPGSLVTVQVTYPFQFAALGFLDLTPLTIDSSASMLVSH